MEKQKNIPELRFPEFEVEWEKRNLGKISVKINSGKTPSGGESVYTEKGILFIRSQNVFDNKLSYLNSTFIPETINNTMKNSVVKPKDILLNITGASLGRSCVVPDDFSTGNVNQHVCIIRIDKNNEPFFIQPFFASKKGQDLFNSLQTGSGREGLNFQSIRTIALYLPTLPEQQKIATFLTAVDDKLTQHKQKKSLLELYKKGVMQKIFSQENRFKDEDGNDYPKWEKKKLGDITNKISDGYHGTPVYDDNGDFYFVNGNNLINNAVVIGENTKTVNYEQFQIHKKPLAENTLLLSINGTIGNLAFYNNEQIILGKSVCYINIGDNLNKVFVFYQLSAEKIKNFFVSELTGTTIKNLSLATIKNTEILIPCLSEQTKIANFLSAIDEKIDHCQLQIEKTVLYKKGLLQKMFC